MSSFVPSLTCPFSQIIDLRPPTQRPNLTDPSAVEKYTMPEAQYEQRADSVLAWKKRQQLGRFDPHAKTAEALAEERRVRDEAEMRRRGLEGGLGKRCRVGGEDARRGVVRFVGEIPGLGGEAGTGCRWVGVEFDEPVGRNDGSVMVEVEEEGKKNEVQKRVFQCKDKFGVLVRPEKVEVGDQWVPLDDLGVDEEMEEL
jgi:tubulin-specific chaperone B